MHLPGSRLAPSPPQRVSIPVKLYVTTEPVTLNPKGPPGRGVQYHDPWGHNVESEGVIQRVLSFEFCTTGVSRE